MMIRTSAADTLERPQELTVSGLRDDAERQRLRATDADEV
jgi:hypothetical protein